MFYGLYLKINENLSRKEKGVLGRREGGGEERRERGNLLLISVFLGNGAGAAGIAATRCGVRRVAWRGRPGGSVHHLEPFFLRN